jgi:cobalt/nickel transport system permease protein
MEGFLPVKWAVAWWLIVIPCLYIGIIKMKRIVSEKPHLKPLLAMAGAFAFVLSALKLPSVTGSSSHMTGLGFGTLFFGPFSMTVLGFIVLLFQALLLAHGGLTTLGANTCSMAIAGPVVVYLFYKLFCFMNINRRLNIFLVAFLGDLVTYIITSLQLAIAHPAINGGVPASIMKFLTVFAVTQIPLALVEGILTVIIIDVLSGYAVREMGELGFKPVKEAVQYEK